MLADAASPQQLAQRASAESCRSVAFTYNDPIIFHEYAIDVAQACLELDIRTVAVTAGYIDPEPRIEFFAAMAWEPPAVGARATWRERGRAMSRVWGVAALFILVIGGIYLGIFTPTEAGAAAAFYALAYGVIFKRGEFLKELIPTTKRTMNLTAVVFFLLGCVGAWSLHPVQIDIARRVFSPSVDEVQHATRVIAAMGDGTGAIMLDGKMEDDASVKQYHVVVGLAKQLSRRDDP